MNLLEVVIALAFFVLLGIPLFKVLSTTTKGAGMSQDYLQAQNIAQMLYEYAIYYASHVDTASGYSIQDLEVPVSVASPHTGTPGLPVCDLQSQPDDTLMPDDGDARFNFAGTNPKFSNLFKRFSYTLNIDPVTSDSAVQPNSGATLYRIDIRVYWKGADYNCRYYRYTNYLAKRNF